MVWHFINGGGGWQCRQLCTQLILWNFNGNLAPGGGGGSGGAKTIISPNTLYGKYKTYMDLHQIYLLNTLYVVNEMNVCFNGTLVSRGTCRCHQRLFR